MMARPANANAAQTRQRIIDAASHLFADKGRGATSVREIAELHATVDPRTAAPNEPNRWLIDVIAVQSSRERS